jgi:hypothetical protein
VRGKKKGKTADVEKNKPTKKKENERKKEGESGLMSQFFSPNRFCVLNLAEEESGFFLERKPKAKIILSRSPGKTNKVLLVMGKRVTRKGKKNDPGSIQEEAETGAEEETPQQQEEPKELPYPEATDSGLEEGLEVEVPAEVQEPAHVGLDSEAEDAPLVVDMDLEDSQDRRIAAMEKAIDEGLEQSRQALRDVLDAPTSTSDQNTIGPGSPWDMQVERGMTSFIDIPDHAVSRSCIPFIVQISRKCRRQIKSKPRFPTSGKDRSRRFFKNTVKYERKALLHAIDISVCEKLNAKYLNACLPLPDLPRPNLIGFETETEFEGGDEEDILGPPITIGPPFPAPGIGVRG